MDFILYSERLIILYSYTVYSWKSPRPTNFVDHLDYQITEASIDYAVRMEVTGRPYHLNKLLSGRVEELVVD